MSVRTTVLPAVTRLHPVAGRGGDMRRGRNAGHVGTEERQKCWPCRQDTLAEGNNCDSKSEITRGEGARPRPPQQALGHRHLEGQ